MGLRREKTPDSFREGGITRILKSVIKDLLVLGEAFLPQCNN